MIYNMNGTSNTLDRFSSIKYVEKVVHLALPITFVSNENAGVIEILDSWIRQYKSQLEGILVSYSNVSLLSHKNKIVGDKFCLLVDIKAKFKLFCPNIGDIVVGKINRISKEHIGCLMHDTINVVIKLKEYFPDELHKFARVERDILFEITHFGCRRKEIVVKGKITPHCMKLMNELLPVIEEDEVTSFSFCNQNTITRYDFDDIDDSSSNYNNESLTSTTNDASSNPDIKPRNLILDSPTLSTKKSKKRKRDSTNHMVDDIAFNNASPISDIKLNEHVSNLSAELTKKSKKRKRDSKNHLPDNAPFNDASLIPDIKPFDLITESSTVLAKKSKKSKRDSTNDLPENVPFSDASLIPDIKPFDLITGSSTVLEKKSKKNKRDSTNHLLNNDVVNHTSPILDKKAIDLITNFPILQTKQSKKPKKDSADEIVSKKKKRKKEDKKKIKGKKDKKLKTKKIGIVPSGGALKNNNKLKKKNSKKSGKSKGKKLKKKHSKEKSKHDVVNNKVEIKSEF